MDEDDRKAKIEECRDNIISLVAELVVVWDEVDAAPEFVAPPTTDEGIQHRMELGGKLITLKRHLRNEIKILSQVESTPNLMDKWEGEESVNNEPD